MLCGDIPYETDEQTLTSGLTWYDNLSLSPASRNLIRGCLNRDIDERLSLDEVIILASHWSIILTLSSDWSGEEPSLAEDRIRFRSLNDSQADQEQR